MQFAACTLHSACGMQMVPWPIPYGTPTKANNLFNTNLTQIEQKFWHPILGSKHSHYGMVTGSRKEKKRNGAKGGMKGRKRKGWTVR